MLIVAIASTSSLTSSTVYIQILISAVNCSMQSKKTFDELLELTWCCQTNQSNSSLNSSSLFYCPQSASILTLLLPPVGYWSIAPSQLNMVIASHETATFTVMQSGYWHMSTYVKSKTKNVLFPHLNMDGKKTSQMFWFGSSSSILQPVLTTEWSTWHVRKPRTNITSVKLQSNNTSTMLSPWICYQYPTGLGEKSSNSYVEMYCAPVQMKIKCE